MNLKSLPIFDFNIHLPIGSKGLDKRIEEDMSMDVEDLGKALDFYTEDLSHLESANYMLFNQYILESEGFKDKFKQLLDSSIIKDNSIFTLLLDFRHPNVHRHLEDANELGIKGIKFHSYLQRIQDKDFDSIVDLCKAAEKIGMFICIDASYGTIDLYKYDNLKLATSVAEHVKDSPIVLLHCGGARILEAMLIAHLQNNIYLESSLTLPFYEGSNLWINIAYAFRKLNCDRILYATDFPYITIERSIEAHKNFFTEYNFSHEEIEKIMFQNAKKLIRSL